ncbi:unnamed protein product [Soboliphyme baturini]|uniref:Cleavage stimulation factor 50 kDa subunit n=1 Tax=Soboliphyme baturini TaxID=241478 RepID=A0A183INQ6_9BILA|nr:unnamed protein product [Soboliphyme baturini]
MNPVKNREYMYQLIISQLYYDNHQQLAINLGKAVNECRPCPPSDKLYRMISAFEKIENAENKDKDQNQFLNESPSTGLDMEYDAYILPTTPEPALYETIFITSHKEACRACAFNDDGSLVASGSADASIKIMDVERMIARENLPPEMEQSNEVKCLAFHPREQILASGSQDSTLKFFDFTKSSVKRAFKTVFEVEPVRCLSFHPTGDFILVGTNHPTLRIYDVETIQSFVTKVPTDQHCGSITDVHYASSGRCFVSASKDGSIKIWDGVSCRCINTFQRAHDGAQICSVVFTRNGKYILSSGKDNILKLWELSTNRCLIAYTGAGATGQQEHRIQAAFNHTEDYGKWLSEVIGRQCINFQFSVLIIEKYTSKVFCISLVRNKGINNA